MTEAHLDLVWPMLDMDGNGSVELDEFLGFMRGTKLNSAEVVQRMALVEINAREDRINNRTTFAVGLAKTWVRLRAQIRQAQADTGKSMHQMFLEFDENHNSTIDKMELFNGLLKIGVQDVTLGEFNM